MSEPIAALIDLELERVVLGQILRFGLLESFEEAGLTRDLFAREEHGFVLDAARSVVEVGAEVDPVTVWQQLRSVEHDERVGAVYYAQLGDGVARPSMANVLFEVGKLQELSASRLVHYATLTLQDALKRPGAIQDGAVTTHLDVVQEAVERHQGAGKPWFDANAQLTAHEREVHEAIAGHRVGFGLPAIDGILGGIRAGEVCGLMGRPGIGKTVFLSVITRAVAEQSGMVFFSLEMPASQIVGRLKQHLYGLSRYAVETQTRTNQLDEGAYRRVFDRLVLVDTPGLSVAEMNRRLRQIQKGPLKHMPVRLVVIDHLGLIGGDRSLSTYDRVSVQAREIKELAKRLECAVLLAIQVNREAGGDGSKELGLGSARDSGVVEEAMDYLIGIRRLDRSLTLSPMERERYKDVILTKVIKNRHGDPGQDEIPYRFSPVGLRLEEDPALRGQAADDISRLAQARAGGRR